MIYHKIPFENGSAVLAELHDDEIVSFCIKCNVEIQLDHEDILQIIKNGSDFGGTSFQCTKCTKKGVI